jgi:hypothetical protein
MTVVVVVVPVAVPDHQIIAVPFPSHSDSSSVVAVIIAYCHYNILRGHDREHYHNRGDDDFSVHGPRLRKTKIREAER